MTYDQTINGICRDLESGCVPSINAAPLSALMSELAERSGARMTRDEAATIIEAQPLTRLAQIKTLRANIAATIDGLQTLDDSLQAEQMKIEARATVARWDKDAAYADHSQRIVRAIAGDVDAPDAFEGE